MTATSTDGNCPNCHSVHWKTLEALELTQRQRSSALTRGPERSQRRFTATTGETEAASKYARPVCPDDYKEMARYRKWCDDSILAAEERLAEIDAASGELYQVLPGLFKFGPDAKSISFGRFSKELERLIQYDDALARWAVTKLCLRCATPFIDAHVHLPLSPAPVFRFSGQERCCTQCGSYFWKKPDAVARGRELAAKQALHEARTTLKRAQAAETNTSVKPPATGWLDRLTAAFTRKEPSVAQALDMVAKAEKAYASAVEAADALRSNSRLNPGLRWCASCEGTYLCSGVVE